MKLATRRTGHPDGELLVVSRDLALCVPATGVAATLQETLDGWPAVAPSLARLSHALNCGEARGVTPFLADQMAAPLPRAWQWLDGSAFPSHGALMQAAFGLPPIATDPPLMYQGLSHRFLGPTQDVVLPSEDDGIDFEGELGVITGAIPMGTSAADAHDLIRLVVQINDWSLRAIAPIEMKTGFGWIQAKPACSMAPVAITPDELGPAWRDGRLIGRLEVQLNGVGFGDVPTTEMQFGFHELMAHAARTRDLCAGTIIGSGTVSSTRISDVGSCCIAERRAAEIMEFGNARTPYLSFGDQVAMGVKIDHDCFPQFGMTAQCVIPIPL